jgi:hypothetical protein
MRLRGRNLTRIGLAVSMAIALGTASCQDSNPVSGMPVSSMQSAIVAGPWNGTFQPGEVSACGSSLATATFQQSGSVVTGNLSTSDCGVAGLFQGRIEGNMLTGKIAMQGCVGGGVSGTFDGSALILSIGDLTKPLIVGQTPVMYGGSVTLHR